MAKLDEGDKAPDFTLPGTDGDFTLSEHRGEKVLLLFYPGDNTMVCTKQFCSYRDHEEDFGGLGVTAVGISSQDVQSHEDFIAKHGLTVPLLADTDGEVSKLYGARDITGRTRRAVFLIDEEGVLRYRHMHLLGATYLSVDDLKKVLETT